MFLPQQEQQTGGHPQANLVKSNLKKILPLDDSIVGVTATDEFILHRVHPALR